MPLVNGFVDEKIYGDRYFAKSSKRMLAFLFGDETHLSFLAALTILELVLGGAGRVITFGSFLTLRYILFFIGLAYFLFILYLNHFKIRSNLFYNPVLLFFAFVAISIMTAMFNQTPLSDIMQASKGYLYLLMIFPFSVYIRNRQHILKAITLFNYAATIIAMISILLFGILLLKPDLYNAVNAVLFRFDFGYLGKIGIISRVFLKTSCFMAIAFILELFRYVNIKEKKSAATLVRMGLQLVGVFTSMTMGIWIALFAGVLLCLCFSKGLKKVAIVLVISFLSVLLFWQFGGYILSILNSRFNAKDESLIVKSNQFVKILQVWSENMLFGKGMGVTIIFKNDIDVRKAMQFEIFWLELLVYTGITGFLSYIYMIIKTLYCGFKNVKLMEPLESALVKALLIGLIMICVITSVNPFLNNPIGIGYFIFVMSAVNAACVENSRNIGNSAKMNAEAG